MALVWSKEYESGNSGLCKLFSLSSLPLLFSLGRVSCSPDWLQTCCMVEANLKLLPLHSPNARLVSVSHPPGYAVLEWDRGLCAKQTLCERVTAPDQVFFFYSDAF